jgi:hypothetical protein
LGCPIDSDHDGVADGIDRCPGTPKGCTVDSVGCIRDADGDSVCDALDLCPDTPRGVTVDAHGCPVELGELEQELTDTGVMRLSDFPFPAGSAEITAAAKQRLDLVGAVLVKWPAARSSRSRATPTTRARRRRTEAQRGSGEGGPELSAAEVPGARGRPLRRRGLRRDAAGRAERLARGHGAQPALSSSSS